MRTYIKNTHEAIVEYLEGLSDGDLLQIHHEYCDACNYPDDEIYDNDEEFLENNFSTKLEAVRAATHGDYNIQHKYARLDGYANIETTSDLSDFLSISEIASNILENPSEYYGIELEEEEEEEE